MPRNSILFELNQAPSIADGTIPMLRHGPVTTR